MAHWIGVREADNAALRAGLNLPPKTLANSCKAKGKPHAVAHGPLHPNPTGKRDAMGSHAGIARPMCRAGFRRDCTATTASEIPEISPAVTRVVLHGGICPWLTESVQGSPAAMARTRLAVRTEPARLCHLR